MDSNFDISFDVWYEVENDTITHKMFHCFDKYWDEDHGRASVKVKFKGGTESKWFHPPRDVRGVKCKYDWLRECPETTTLFAGYTSEKLSNITYFYTQEEGRCMYIPAIY